MFLNTSDTSISTDTKKIKYFNQINPIHFNVKWFIKCISLIKKIALKSSWLIGGKLIFNLNHFTQLTNTMMTSPRDLRIATCRDQKYSVNNVLRTYIDIKTYHRISSICLVHAWLVNLLRQQYTLIWKKNRQF